MENQLISINNKSEAIYKEKGSKFIALIIPAKSKEEVKEILKKIKREHHKARHHCYAYRLGQSGTDIRACDDGEPPKTAGYPILRQIEATQLTDILIVVVRYFGGTLLGTGGLINAYRTASQDAIRNYNSE